MSKSIAHGTKLGKKKHNNNSRIKIGHVKVQGSKRKLKYNSE